MFIDTKSKEYQYSYDELITLLKILSDIVYVHYNIDNNGDLCNIRFENSWTNLDDSDELNLSNEHRKLLARFASTGQQNHIYNIISSDSAKMLLKNNDDFHYESFGAFRYNAD